MKVYYNGKHKNQRLYVQPGSHHPEVAEWQVNNTPKMIVVNFKNGMAEVEKNLGEYLINHNLVSKNKVVELLDEAI